MAIIATDLKHYHSGGSANTDPMLSIGGAKSSVESTSALFDDVSSAEAAAGDIEYRLVYMQNGHGTLTAQSAKVFISTQTPSPSTDLAIGLAAVGANAVETAVANENTAPAGVTFSSPATYAAGLSLGNLAPGQYYGVWLRRTVTAGAGVFADSATVVVQCDTNP